mmetsp:Transcript_13999/g.18247  ORF Transcript_13999/g.18247 Transcript_13999/m.18247 type:complete len:138 (+) Transcript_13999:79-492(+)
MADPPFLPPEPPANNRKKKEMTEHQRLQALSMLLVFAEDGVLPYGSITQIAKKLGVTRSSLSKLWNKAGQARAHGHVAPADVFSRKKTSSGRKQKYCQEMVEEEIATIPLPCRKSIRALAFQLDIPKSTLHRISKRS